MATPALDLNSETREKAIELLYALVFTAETPRKPIQPEPSPANVVEMRRAG